MGDVDRDLAEFIGSVLPNSSSRDLVLETLQSLGVETLEDLKYVQEPDLVNILRPIEARKLIARINALCADNSNSPPSTSSSSESSTPHRPSPVDNNWHFNFEIPWSKMPSEITRKLKNKERPTGRERRELIRLMVAEILTICPSPGKKHLSEISRKIVSTYPQSFRDVIEDQVVGSGYDSLTKQLQSRVDNMRRGKNSLFLKRQTSSASEGEDPPCKMKRVDTYGCINWQPKRLPLNETEDTQKCTQEELKNMHKNKRKNTKSIENKMMATFYTQRSNIISGMETPVLVKEWPYLFEMCGIMVHFKELTGMDVDREAMSSKCKRVISYLISHEKKNKIEDILSGMEIAKAKDLDADLPGCVLLLLKYFSEEQAKMFQLVDETSLPSEVDQLPSTPCIVVCGSSPLTAGHFMIAVDQIIVKDGVTNCGEALLMMFVTYYCLNISYPAELGATLEFMQRCLFKINPDKGTKVEKKESKKQQSVNPKVLSLITNIANFEWRE
ncbi:hypothetical protein ROHU_004411 [Labeo rohita]|uniref:Interferon-induced 44 n=1 Tax=Labeo rohita TaxID=84645 RepID=A0A498NM43_LABRO|nr:hypothetical protein ROHU_004411 [Labeo rohita]